MLITGTESMTNTVNHEVDSNSWFSPFCIIFSSDFCSPDNGRQVAVKRWIIVSFLFTVIYIKWCVIDGHGFESVFGRRVKGTLKEPRFDSKAINRLESHTNRRTGLKLFYWRQTRAQLNGQFIIHLADQLVKPRSQRKLEASKLQRDDDGGDEDWKTVRLRL